MISYSFKVELRIGPGFVSYLDLPLIARHKIPHNELTAVQSDQHSHRAGRNSDGHTHGGHFDLLKQMTAHKVIDDHKVGTVVFNFLKKKSKLK